MSERVATVLSDRLFAEVTKDADLRPRWDPLRVLAYAVAVGIHLVTAAVFLGGVLFLGLGAPNPVAIFIGVFLVLLAVLLRPRFGTLPKRLPRVSRADAPALYGLLDRLARETGAHTVNVVVVGDAFNASYSAIGLRRRRVVAIGLQLWNVIAWDQRVALLGHELGHDVNGDAVRGVVVGSALNSLAEWHRMLAPGKGRIRVWSRTRTAEDLTQFLVLRPLSWIVLLLFRAERRLVYYGQQRAEYLADEISARVAGTQAALAIQDQLLLGPTCRGALERAVRYGNATDLWAAERQHVIDFPPRELERLRRVAARQPSRLEFTHPSYSRRQAALRSRQVHHPTITVDPAEGTAIDAELDLLKQGIGNSLREKLRG